MALVIKFAPDTEQIIKIQTVKILKKNGYFIGFIGLFSC